MKKIRKKTLLYHNFKKLTNKLGYWFIRYSFCNKIYEKYARITTKRGDFSDAAFFWKKLDQAYPQDGYKVMQDLCFSLEKSGFIKSSKQEELLNEANYLLQEKFFKEALNFFVSLCQLNPIPSARFYLTGGYIFQNLINDGLEKFDQQSVKILIEKLYLQNPVSFIGTNDYPVICSVMANNIMEKNYQKLVGYLKNIFAGNMLQSHVTLACFLSAFDLVDIEKRRKLFDEFFDEFWKYGLWPMALVLDQYNINYGNSRIFRELLEKKSSQILSKIADKPAKRIFEFITITKALHGSFYHQLIERLKNSQLQSSKNPASFFLDLEYVLGKKNLYTDCAGKIEWHSVIKPRNQKLKIAICISGQLRGYKKAFPTWKNLVSENFELTHFVHSWKNIGRANLDGERADRSLSGKFLQEWKNIWFILGEGEMRKRYQNFFKICNRSNFVTSEEIKEFYNTKHVVIEDDTKPPFTGFSNPQKMYYKAYECHKMMRNSGDFDLVIRIRPDKKLIIERPVDWDLLYKNLSKKSSLMVDLAPIVSTSKYKNFFMGDQVAIGLTPVMDIYCATYKMTQEVKKIGLNGFPGEHITHANFGLSCLYHDIEVMPISGFVCSDLLSVDVISAQEVLDAIKQDIKIPRDAMDVALFEAAIHDASNSKS